MADLVRTLFVFGALIASVRARDAGGVAIALICALLLGIEMFFVLRFPVRPDRIEMAFGLIRALHEAGRSVPEDISVVSVDDIALAAYASPALTTVRQPFEAMGRAAALRLITQIEGHDPVGEMPSTDPQLIVRSSTAPPRVTR